MKRKSMFIKGGGLLLLFMVVGIGIFAVNPYAAEAHKSRAPQWTHICKQDWKAISDRIKELRQLLKTESDQPKNTEKQQLLRQLETIHLFVNHIKGLPSDYKNCSPALDKTPVPTVTVTATATWQPTPKPSVTSTPVQPTPTATPKPVQPTPTATPPVSGNPGNTGMTSEEYQLAQQLLQKINQDRAAYGLPAYQWNDTIARAAYKHSRVMANCGMTHQCTSQNEPSLGNRLKNEGVNWSTCGENVGYAYGNSNHYNDLLRIHTAMMNERPPEDGHLKNLISSSFKQIGIGVFIDSTGKVWLTEDFTN